VQRYQPWLRFSSRRTVCSPSRSTTAIQPLNGFTERSTTKISYEKIPISFRPSYQSGSSESMGIYRTVSLLNVHLTPTNRRLTTSIQRLLLTGQDLSNMAHHPKRYGTSVFSQL
jgi:hypothetical protein